MADSAHITTSDGAFWASQGVVGQPSASNAEATLVVQAQAGDTAAFDTLMRTYRERVWGVVYNLTANRDDAADVTQDVFIKAFTNIHKYNFRASFFTWLYRIAVNEALNHQRKHRLKRALTFEKFLPDQSKEEFMEQAAATPSSAPGALQSELQVQLNKALLKLSEEHRTVVVLSEIEALPLREVAEILKTSEGTVKSRLHYAKKQLQNYLKPYLTV